MFPRPIFARLQRALGEILRAERSCQDAQAELDELETLRACAQRRLAEAQKDLRGACRSWDAALDSAQQGAPSVDHKLPMRSSDPGFRADRVQLQVA